ncbi:MAG: prephenate dehydrogenase/arogenate dehydrogenase family protein [Anaerolineales bacterium]|nr:prephenate dehydrogenase/arogenate dehydrogenase family protein [Anaerolineales bacterium]
MTVEILFVGLDEIGASMSLAFAAAGVDMTTTGHDPNPELARDARDRQVVERLVTNARKAAQTADLIFFSLQANDAADYFDLLAPVMKEDCVLIDLSHLKRPAFSLAQTYVPEGRYFVGATPVINPSYLLENPDDALPRHDLFQGGLLALAHPPINPESVINLSLGVAKLIGATPFFLDAMEIDAANATVDDLPTIMGLALMQLSMNAPSWREIQRLTGRSWTTAVGIGARRDSKDLAATLIENKLSVLNRLTSMQEELIKVHTLVSDEDLEALTNYCEQSSEAYMMWLDKRKVADWEGQDHQPPEIPKIGVFERLFSTDAFRRKSSK